jgi:hypothetical protein
MSPLRRNCLIAALVSALLLGSVVFSLQNILIPSMLESGNRSLLNATATALTSFYADFQRWPQGSTTDVWAEVTGRPAYEGGSGSFDPAQSTPLSVAEALPLMNYLRDLPARASGTAIVDAWGVPFQFEFPEGGSARIMSAGPDQRFGTSDDMTSEAPPAPKNTRPRRIDVKRAQEIRRHQDATEAKRKSR